MKKTILLAILLSGVGVIYAQKFHVNANNAAEQLKSKQLAMDYERVIRLVDSLQLTDVVAFQAKVGAQTSLGLVKEAANTIYAALKLYPQNAEVIAGFAEAATIIGNDELAMTCWNLATRLRPTPQWMNRKAELLCAKKRFQESVAVADSILEKNNIPSVVRLKARNLAALKDIAGSARILEAQCRNQNKDYLAFKQLANLYLAVDSAKRLSEITDEYLQQDSLNTEILNFNAKAHYLQNNYQKSIECYRKMERLGDVFDYDKNLFCGLAFYKADSDLPYDAFPYFLKADTLSEGRYYIVKYYLGKTAEKIGKTKDAEKYYQEALQIIEPDTVQLAQLLNTLGKMQMMNRQPREALKSYYRALQFRPQDPTAFISIALAYDYLKDIPNALKYYEEVIRVLPDTVNDAYSHKAAERIKYLKEQKNKR